MNCQEVKEKLSHYLETDLPEGEKTAIQQHLLGCPSCREELESLSKIIETVKQLPEIETPSGFSNRVMARVREEETRKTDPGKLLPFFGFRGFAYGFVVLLVGGIIYYMFQIQKPAPVQLAQSIPPVAQEAPAPPIISKKEELYRSEPEKDRLASAPAPRIAAKTVSPTPALTAKPAPSMEAKSEPIQSFNQPVLREKRKEALQPTVQENNDKVMGEADLAKKEMPLEQSYPSSSGRFHFRPALPAAPPQNLSAGSTPASNEMTGLAILQMSESHLGGDQTSTVTLHLFSKEGDEKKIVTKRFWKNFKGKDGIGSKTIFFTEYPPDAKGTGFLIVNFAEAGKPDNLWLYLPSLRQSRQVSSRDQDGAFMGSDLTFGDMGQRRLEEDDHKLLKEEACGTEQCYVVESVAKDKEGIYSKKVLWITKIDFITMKIDYYDRKGELLKTQQINWQEASGYKAWKSSEVVNVQTQHKTIFKISDLKINTGLSNDLFKEKTLKTGTR